VVGFTPRLPPGKEPTVSTGYEVGWTTASEPSVVQLLASCYTDYAMLAHDYYHSTLSKLGKIPENEILNTLNNYVDNNTNTFKTTDPNEYPEFKPQPPEFRIAVFNVF
jgi:hypothetical protein